jgi:hypothetical protein
MFLRHNLEVCLIKKKMNQLRISMANRFYSAGVTIDNHQPNNDLNMRVISGFVDGEGCFSLTISKDSSLKIG